MADRERPEVRPEALRGHGAVRVLLEDPLDDVDVVVERPDLDAARQLGVRVPAPDQACDGDVLVEQLGGLGQAERIGLERVHLAALDVRDLLEDVAVVAWPAELATGAVDLLAGRPRESRPEQALGGHVDGAHRAGQPDGIDRGRDEVPLLDGAELGTGEVLHDRPGQAGAHQIVERIATDDQPRPVGRDAGVLAEHLDELVGPVSQAMAFLDQVLVDVDPRRRVDQFGQHARAGHRANIERVTRSGGRPPPVRDRGARR